MSSSNISQVIINDTCKQRIEALQAYVPPNTEIEIAGVPYKLADAIAIYQTYLDTTQAVIGKRVELKGSLDTRRGADVKRRAFDKGLKSWVATKFGSGSNAAHAFGFQPKARVTTVAAKTHGIALAKATRIARHTAGKKQKSLIKGTVVAPTAPAAPAVIVVASPATLTGAPGSADTTKTNGAPSAPPTSSSSNGTAHIA